MKSFVSKNVVFCLECCRRHLFTILFTIRLFTCDRTPDILQRPVMSFVLQWNDLDSLTIAMTQALRKAACRTYALQALNW